MGMNMPEVSKCSVEKCAYNSNQACHAIAITIGQPAGDPSCDTYFEASRHGGVKDLHAGVGACKLADCKLNLDYECSAPQIKVGINAGQPDCLTYDPR